MFKTVIVATDLSAASDAVIAELAFLRPLGTETAILCHALGIHGHETLFSMLALFVEPRLKQQQERLERHGFKVIVEIAPGVPALEIHRVASDRGAGLIVVGSKGATLASEVLLGGTATEVLHHATIPVLIIRLAVDEENGVPRCRPVLAGPILGVLHPTDFSMAAMKSFATVEDLASKGVGRIVLLHVCGVDMPELVHKYTAELEFLKQRLFKRGIKDVSMEVLVGDSGREIVARASRGDSDLIVMGSQGQSLFEEVFLGSVGHYVARHAPVPVLLVPFTGPKSGSSAGVKS